MTSKEMIDEINESLLYCTHKDREVYPWDSSQRQMAKRVIELARLGEKYEQLLADMKERKTGKWIDGHCMCSICKWYPTNRYGFAVRADYNYCPNCGAKMEADDRT